MIDSSGKELQLRWVSPRIPDDQIAAEEKIRKELVELDCDPLEILFHTVFIDDMDGPCISVTPSDDKTCMECYYDEDPEWTTFADLGDDPFEGKEVQIFDPKGKQRDESDS